MSGFSRTAHWRDSARHPRFFFVDARAAFPLILFLVHIRLWTFVLAIVTMTFFFFIERAGVRLGVFLRLVRTFLAGSHKTASPWWKR